GVGVQGLSLSEVSYQNAVDYARERLQGRSLSGTKAPDKAADPIIVHADVRRMLMTSKAFNEAARALVIWTALAGDVAERGDDEKTREAAEDFMGLMTPVVKGVLTDLGFANAVNAQQVYGGHGFIAEWGMEQFVRDARIPMIYEGTNGIQALDLVGRKLGANGGRAVMTFFKEVGGFMKENSGNAALAPFLKGLEAGRADLEKATMWFMQNALAKPDNAGAGSTDYMHLFGLVALGYMWARILKAVEEQRGSGNRPDSFYDAKVTTAKFFFERMLPETGLRLARITAGADSMMDLPAEAF
ncbi:MAG: acyl-CoA dehydrogenase C-terminal domain-containing protein, partial [Hyphomicrobiales bacterium]|nr:acyl-CoA dehydrogenase C-terminal domain-containing protein [Hyphomicrobiales bacterium]